MHFRSLLLALALAIVAAACTTTTPWDSPDAWYQTGTPVNPAYADVLYFVSTEVAQAADGSHLATLTPEDRDAIGHEMAYIRREIYPDSLNFFSPFYHQVTASAFSLPDSLQAPLWQSSIDECLSAFDFYIDNLNGGRPFILSGFSQGAMAVKQILKHMSDDVFSRLVAAYVIGEELTADDLSSPHILPATGPSDRSVTISFNSVAALPSAPLADGSAIPIAPLADNSALTAAAVADPSCIWPLVCHAPAACINPVNWTTTSAPATLLIPTSPATTTPSASSSLPATTTPSASFPDDGLMALSVAVDTLAHVVVVTGYGDNLPEPPIPGLWPRGCLHGQEIRIYASSLARNALLRAY